MKCSKYLFTFWVCISLVGCSPRSAPTVDAISTHSSAVPLAFEFPFPVIVSAGEWIIEHPAGERSLKFDPSQWKTIYFDEIEPLHYEGGPVLQYQQMDDCVLSLNVGGGVPMDWRLNTTEVQLGEHIFKKTIFRDSSGEVQFVIYNELFRVAYGYEQDGCLEAIEKVLGSYQVIDIDE